MVDFWPRPPERSYPDLLLKKLRPGDIHTHVFAQQFPILSADGKVNDFLFAARERGVHFDLGHGAASFWFRNAVPAFRERFPARHAFHRPAYGQHQRAGGQHAEHDVQIPQHGHAAGRGDPALDHRPAQVIGRPELGTLSAGAEADVAVFELLEGTFGFADCGKAKLVGSQKLECRLTLRAGQIVYDPSGLSMPEWEQAPESYWEMPELQPRC